MPATIPRRVLFILASGALAVSIVPVAVRSATASVASSDRYPIVPGTRHLHWPTFNATSAVVSLDSPRSQLEQNFSAAHHCGFWAAG